MKTAESHNAQLTGKIKDFPDDDALWDKFSEHIGDDIDLEVVAGRSIITQRGFVALAAELATLREQAKLYQLMEKERPIFGIQKVEGGFVLITTEVIAGPMPLPALIQKLQELQGEKT